MTLPKLELEAIGINWNSESAWLFVSECSLCLCAIANIRASISYNVPIDLCTVKC